MQKKAMRLITFSDLDAPTQTKYEIKFKVYGKDLAIPLANAADDSLEDSGDDGYSIEVVRKIFAAKDLGFISNKTYHELNEL